VHLINYTLDYSRCLAARFYSNILRVDRLFPKTSSPIFSTLNWTYCKARKRNLIFFVFSSLFLRRPASRPTSRVAILKIAPRVATDTVDE